MTSFFPETKLSLDALRALQLERLRAALGHAYAHQAPYRAKCQAAGIHPDDLRSSTIFGAFPSPRRPTCATPIPTACSPSRGRNACGCTPRAARLAGRRWSAIRRRDIDTWADLMARSLHAGGARPGDIIHNAYGYGLFTGGLGAHYGAERLGCTVVPMSGGFGERQVQLIREFGARVVLMTPSYMLAIADEFERQGVDPRDTAMRIGIFGAEPWTEGMRAEIERRAGIDAVDIYGLSEVMGPGVACEFVETKDGPTIWEDHFYPEIVDPEIGSAGRGGRTGRACFHVAHQGGDAGHPLPHARPDTPDAGIDDGDAAHGQDHRPQRRHADRARREFVPEPGRGADPARPGADRTLPDRAHAQRRARRPVGAGRSTDGAGRSRSPAARRRRWRCG